MAVSLAEKPGADEASPYYFTYIDKVPPGDVRETIERQKDETLPFLRGISEETSLTRYAPGKWSLRETFAHVNDAERLFTFRAFWFARGFEEPLPSFEQETAVAAGRADDLAWARHIEDFAAIRAATITLFRNLPDAAWDRRGVASGNAFTVRAFAWIVAGHLAHHVEIAKERALSA